MEYDFVTAAIEDLSERALDWMIEYTEDGTGLAGVLWSQIAQDILAVRARKLLSSLPNQTLAAIQDGRINVPAVFEDCIHAMLQD